MPDSNSTDRNQKSARRSMKRRADSFIGNFRFPVTSKFGAAVRERRKALGLTQAELAEAAGLNQTFLSDVERGQEGISLERAASLANALKCKLSDLLKEN